jgi:hypothetical protein
MELRAVVGDQEAETGHGAFQRIGNPPGAFRGYGDVDARFGGSPSANMPGESVDSRAFDRSPVGLPASWVYSLIAVAAVGSPRFCTRDTITGATKT